VGLVVAVGAAAAMVAADVASTPAASVDMALETTEMEPDDDWQPSLTSTTIGEKQASSDKKASGEDEPHDKVKEDEPVAAEREPTPPEELPPPNLQGAWHQLEGVPRPLGIGPRFLLWNSYGHVSAFPGQNRMLVQYADQAFGEQRFADFTHINMASLSEGACCLAATATSDKGPQLLIRPAERWEKAVFSAPFGSIDESAEAVACGDGFAAALTNQRLLRVYSTSGLPLAVTAMSGRSVALAARGPLLLVVTAAAGVGLPAEGEDDALEFRLLDVRAHTQRAFGRLPLSPASRLRWIGISTELAPVAIDTAGVVRALLGAGPGCWGPANSGCGEWMPVLSLAEEESRCGPLWTVSAGQSALYVAEIGADAMEPQPAELDLLAAASPTEGALDNKELETSDAPAVTPAPPTFGHGAGLRKLDWKLPLGPVAAAGDAAEQALRDHLFARHAEELSAAGLLGSNATASTAALVKTWRQSSFQLFCKLAKAGEVERAFDVARNMFGTGAAQSKSLELARVFADRAGLHKLADKVAAIHRQEAGSQQAVAKAAPQTVPRTTRPQAMRPLFSPGEAENAAQVSQEATPPHPPSAASVPSKPAGTPASSPPSLPASTPAPSQDTPEPSKVAAAQSVAAATAAPTAARANPFAKKRAPNSSALGGAAPHLLRDALGGTGGEPASKMSKTVAGGR